jgi:hypothetical protein
VLLGDLIINSGGSSERIKGIQKALLTPFLNVVQHQLADFRHGGPIGTPSANNDAASQLEKLAALRDRGVLTAENSRRKK